ncbi:hypothetical protein [Nafulsella turpanensis]|uniref:hypothetical protein n=1 Tax=Nafulsella turpanensis TaxID=1265690 RepID=UPI00037B7CCD|nr:hypothetical protein [Nafulsella turpanensis]
MESYQKFKQFIDPQKAEQNAQQLLSTMSEVQGIFLYLQTHTDLSIIRSLTVVEQHLKTKEGKNLPDLLKPISEEYPELKLLPVYRSAVSHFSRHFPAAAVRDYIKTKEAILEQQDYSQPENRVFLKVQAIDWEKIFAFLEDHYFLLSLWNKIKTHHPEMIALAKGFAAEISNNVHNYLEAEEASALDCLIGKSKKNKGINIRMTSRVKEALKQPMVEAFDRLKELALQKDCKLTDFELLLPTIKAALEKVNLNKLSIKKVMLQKLLEYIKVDKGDESIQFLILHDLLKLLYPYKFTLDAAFLKEGPIFNKNGSMDGEVRKNKIREAKKIMGIPING